MISLTASTTGDYTAKSIRLRENSTAQIKLQLNSEETPTEITYTIDQDPQIIKTLSSGNIVKDEDASNALVYVMTINDTDNLKTGYWNHYVQIETTTGNYTLSLDKGRVRIER